MEREAAPSKAAVTSPDAATAQPIAASSLGAVQEASNAGVASAAAAGPSALLAAPGTPAAAAAARPPSSLQAGTSTSTAGAGKPAGGGREAARRLSGGTQADVMTPPVCLALSLASVGIAGLLLMTPGLAARGLFRKDAIHPLDAQHVSLGRMDAAGALADAGALAALALPHDSWARAGMGARAADLLKLGLAARGLADTVNSARYSGAVSPLLVLPFLLATASGFVLPAWDLLAAGRSKGLLGELRCRLAPPTRSLLAGAHYLLSLLLPASGAALLTFCPRFASYHMFGYSYGASASLMATLAGGASMFTLPMTNLLLKDAAISGALGTAPAQVLNAGQLLAALPHLAVLLPMLMGGGSSAGGAGWLMPAHTATWLFALVTSAAGLLAGRPKPASMGETAGEATMGGQTGKED